MPKRIVPLSDMQVLKAKPRGKQYTMFDGGGLFLLITPTGGKLWRYKYLFESKNQTMTLGIYPDISLAEARVRHQDARKLLAHGVNPQVNKKIAKAVHDKATADSFEVIAREWHTTFFDTWGEKHRETIISRLQREVFPTLGNKPVGEITAPDVLAILKRMESRGALGTAHRVKIMIGQVLRYATATGRSARDVTIDLRGAIPPEKYGHRSAPVEPDQLRPILISMDGYEGSFVVKCAMRLLPMLLCRPGELRAAEWSEFDLDNALWSIPAARMKMDNAHLVPLSTQAVAILKELYPLTRHSRYVFPGHRSPLRCMSDNAINAGLRRMGIEKAEACAHGFRATARTMLDEIHEYRVDWIEHQLAHAVKDPNGRAYNRTKYLKQRTEMMQFWADYLDCLKVTS